jgi:hypothetical protein
MTQDREQQSRKQHQEESWPLFMSREQREQLIRNKFARAVQHFKFHGEKYVRSNHTGNILQNR